MSASTEDGRYSREEFRRWCADQPRGRFERVDGRIVAMAPERIGHVRIKAAAHRARQQLADYFRLASVQQYLIVHPGGRVIIHHRRASDGIGTQILSSGPLRMDPPGLSVTVEEILTPSA